MKIKLIAVGNLKEKYLKDALLEYTKRLSKFCHFEMIEIKEQQDTKVNAMELEGEKILKCIKPHDYIVALALNYQEYTSEELAKWMERTFIKADGEIVFVIGGSLGLSKEVINRADERLTLSKLTFTHQMSRVILLEQIYRAFKINHHEKYHK